VAGETLVVAANLSREFQSWQPEEADGDWQVLMSNYAEAASPCRHDPAAV
jgi:trehalose-6-phosphate hydrolase